MIGSLSVSDPRPGEEILLHALKLECSGFIGVDQKSRFWAETKNVSLGSAELGFSLISRSQWAIHAMDLLYFQNHRNNLHPLSSFALSCIFRHFGNKITISRIFLKKKIWQNQKCIFGVGGNTWKDDTSQDLNFSDGNYDKCPLRNWVKRLHLASALLQKYKVQKCIWPI